MTYYYSIKPADLPDWSPMAIYADAFTSEECDQIKSMVADVESYKGAAGPGVNAAVRTSDISWLNPSEETVWLYDKLSWFFHDVNTYRYRMDIQGFSDPIQFAKYEADGQYNWHLDIGPNTQNRKLTMIVNLDRPDAYTGGGTQIQIGTEPEDAPKDQGTVIIFPSYVLHRGQMVQKGVRNVLVAWAGGPHLR